MLRPRPQPRQQPRLRRCRGQQKAPFQKTGWGLFTARPQRGQRPATLAVAGRGRLVEHGDVSGLGEDLAQLVEDGETVVFDGLVLVVDHHLLKEVVHVVAQLS